MSKYADAIAHERGWKPVHIYMLVDPRTDEIRYVGKSVNPSERLNVHMNERSNCHRSHWLQELKREGLLPHMFILETIEGEWPWQESERWWIARLKAGGARLTNSTSGGDGVPDLPPETREKIRLASVGRKPSPEVLQRLSEARKGRKSSPETCAKHSRAMRGRKILWIDKIAERNRKISPETAAIIAKRLEAGELVKNLAIEYRIHRTTLSKIKLGRYFTTGQ